MKDRNLKIPVPGSMKVQLSRLFGSKSEKENDALSLNKWKQVLKKILKELYLYLEENVDTDQVHKMMLYSGLDSANEALKDDYFWPGYIEGIIRLTLLLMGDYPDHRRRKGGRKKKEHYKLDRMRSVHYTMNSSQKLNTLIAASLVGYHELSRDPLDTLREFRNEVGYEANYKKFLSWYKKRYPEDYAKIF